MPKAAVRGTEVHHLEVQPRSASRGRKVVFVHGSGGNAHLWQRVMDGLAEEFGSLAIDLPGHGESQGEGVKSIPEYREFLKHFLDVLKLEEIILGGHSLGGGIAIDFALRYPERLKAILLIGTGARLRVFPEALEMFRQMASGQMEPRFEPWGFAAGASPEVLAEGKHEWAKTNSRVRYHDMMACDQFDLLGEVEKIRLPALVVCGREDRLTPVKYSEYLNKKIIGSKIEVIEGAGHMIMLEDPRALSEAILGFLNSFR